MKNLLRLITFSFALAAAAARADCEAPRILTPKTDNGVEKLVNVVNALTAEMFEKPMGQRLNQVVGLIDPRLVDADGSCQLTVHDYDLQVIPKIDADMMFELMQKLPADNRHGFAILSRDFWRGVEQAQLAGLKVAWIVASPAVVNGVYFRAEKTIGVAWHADIATLNHELRHHRQASRFAYRDEFQQKLIDRQAEYSYAGDCLGKLNTYFGELDATTEDLAYWPEYFKFLVPAVAIGSQREFPALHLFKINLSYPFQVSEPVLQDTACPQSFKTAVREIWDLLKRTDMSVPAQQLANTLFVASGLDARTEQSRIRFLVTKADGVLAQIKEQLPLSLKERREGIRAVLKKLPDADYNLWCSYSGSFAEMAGCP